MGGDFSSSFSSSSDEKRVLSLVCRSILSSTDSTPVEIDEALNRMLVGGSFSDGLGTGMTGSLLVDVETDSGLIPLTRASEFTVSVRLFTCSGVAVPIFGAPVNKAV